MAAISKLTWPPAISTTQLDELTLLATTYALSHGLIYLPVLASPPLAPTASIHAPLALFPSPLPRELFNLAKRLQRIYNVLYSRVAIDQEFLDGVMGEVGKVDDFTGQLWRRWKRLRDEGVKQVRCRSHCPQKSYRPPTFSANTARAFPLGLHAPCIITRSTCLLEASGIQYYFVLLWDPLRAGFATTSASLLS